MKPDPRISNLPKWAQAHIADLEREKNNALATCAALAENQPPSNIYVDDWYSTPRIKRYVNSPLGRITVEHAGVKLEAFCARKDDGQREFGIELQYTSLQSRLGLCTVAIIPRGVNIIALVAKENIR